VSSGGTGNASGGSATGGSSPTGGTSTGGSLSSGGAPAASGGQNSTGGGASATGGGPPLAPATFQLMDEVAFYDAYAGTVDEEVPEGILRLDNSLFATRLTDEQLAQIQAHLTLDVTIGALCDNYDRIGSVRLAFVPKAQSSYGPNDGSTRIELGRFITPFMDKNVQPDEVPYSWEVDHVAAILRSPELQATYDFWFELSVFGVPYAANEEVAGCAGRSDVFRGWLSLSTDSTVPDRTLDVVLPLAFEEPFNDYQVGASDAIGTTTKTIEFSLDSALEDAEVVLIVSNHGANSGGEEYIRREHIALLDGEPALVFTPGRSSCEPFRMFNTQANGIYGATARSDADWQSFSNWCPGDVIDVRRIPWAGATAGAHEFVLDVSDAVFTGDEGNFPLSVFVIGRAEEP
jgi:hypothetical protein